MATVFKFKQFDPDDKLGKPSLKDAPGGKKRREMEVLQITTLAKWKLVKIPTIQTLIGDSTKISTLSTSTSIRCT
jgi:hypothetical protein